MEEKSLPSIVGKSSVREQGINALGCKTNNEKVALGSVLASFCIGALIGLLHKRTGIFVRAA